MFSFEFLNDDKPFFVFGVEDIQVTVYGDSLDKIKFIFEEQREELSVSFMVNV